MQLRVEDIVPPQRPRREVSCLTPEDLGHVIGLKNRDGSARIAQIRLRALIESLLGSAMRIEELLGLNIRDLDFETQEARVIGKGNKQRVVFFTDRALSWLKQYLDLRTNEHPALFVCPDGMDRLNHLGGFSK